MRLACNVARFIGDAPQIIDQRWRQDTFKNGVAESVIILNVLVGKTKRHELLLDCVEIKRHEDTKIIATWPFFVSSCLCGLNLSRARRCAAHQKWRALRAHTWHSR